MRNPQDYFEERAGEQGVGLNSSNRSAIGSQTMRTDEGASAGESTQEELTLVKLDGQKFTRVW